MGILRSNAELLIKAKKAGVSFDRVLTLGHLKLFLTKQELRNLVTRYELDIDVSSAEDYIYADEFFRKFLASSNVQSLDYSNYEDSNILHDMNENIDSKYYEKFDVVIDGGSLEHIFNFPVALANCMKMLKQGGRLYVFTMANNHMGHGFYQFSPELFFRCLSENSGFKVINILLEEHKYPGAELNQKTSIYEVEDPYNAGSRVGLVSKSPVMMMVHAIRKEIKPIFDTYPIQSDYDSTYERHEGEADQRSQSATKYMTKKFFLRLPKNIRYFIEGNRQLAKYSFRNTSFYKPRVK